MFNSASVGAVPVTTSSRSEVLADRLEELRKRLLILSSLSASACRLVSGESPKGIESAQLAHKLAPSIDMGLYSNTFAVLDELNSLCSEIEGSLREVLR